MSNGIDGALAFVVGGSRGLGRDLASALHAAGARTIALSRHPGTDDPPWENELLDATDATAVDRFFETWGPRLAERVLLVNFAGSRYNVPLVDSEPERWTACVESSLLTTYLMTRGLARALQGRTGAILNMASIHAEAAAAGRSAYAAAKAGVVQLTAVSAVELAPLGIRVNCIAPGFIATEASTEMIAAGTLDGAGIERRTPLGRLGDPADVTRTALFLLSHESAFITGQTIRVDGGWLGHAEV
jgi:NAD(P)-dependent dehydrogenase (short-subunit alcohol dehydrogenase family)